MTGNKKAPEKSNFTLNGEDSFLIIHNDETNTFDHVIETLIDVCDHDITQAEQCAMITHYKGKCDVKRGNHDLLNKLRRRIVKKGINATIE
jgi:ATP-dependent Clp protease adaptor protein ClpS